MRVGAAPPPAVLPARAPLRIEGWLAFLLPLAVVSAACVVYLALDLHPVDLAASTYRANLFADHGLALWNGNWYGGHYTLSYSVLSPPLTWLFGSVPLEIACALISTALFHLLVRRHFGERAAGIGAIWFALAAGTLVFHGRVPFAIGVSLGLGALLALQCQRGLIALAFAFLCGLASPVAGLFVALAGVSSALADGLRPRSGFALAATALVPVLAIQLAFPEGGQQPYRLSDLAWLVASVAIALVLLPRGERALRIGTRLYGLGGLGAYVLSTPLGNNVCRLAPLAAGPLLACVLVSGRARRRPALVVAALLAVLVYFQWKPVVQDVGKVRSDPVVEASYYRPLLGFLGRAQGPPFRVEIPFTQAHWEAAEVARRFPLARGWERQLDGTRDALFYGGVLNRLSYGTWLAEHGVRFVAVASGKPDYSSYRERALIETGLPFLKLVWRSREWRVYEVTLPHAILIPHGDADMRLVSLGNSALAIDVRVPGDATVKVHWSPYWRARGGCVERAGQWTRVTARRPGTLRVAIDFSPERIFAHGRRCD
ncbi:MAG: hypothetical protein QOF55_2006 [Thermoleophilaceae bacterium]|nr:hypothetical protein [Thermoleophilaceae bacterium]